MKYFTSIGLALVLSLYFEAISPSRAQVVIEAQLPPQRDEMQIDEQPGVEPTTDEAQLDPQYQRQLVLYRTNEPPGSIIIQASERFLYLVQGNNRAIRYGIGVGRQGFQWGGLLKI